MELANPGKLWDELTPDQQRSIGVAAIIHLIGGDDPHDDEEWNWEAAYMAGAEAMRDAYATTAFNGPTAPPRIDLNAIGVRMCTKCGCTDECGCIEGCGWSTPSLCSRCA